MDSLLSRQQVAAYLSISLATLDRLRQQPGFPKPARVGSGLRWFPDDLDAWLRSGIPHDHQPAASGRRRSAEELMT